MKRTIAYAGVAAVSYTNSINAKTSIFLQCASAQTSSMSVFLDLAATGTEHIGTLEFWRYALMYMQQDQGNTTSQCITTFDDWTELVQDLLASIVDDTEYVAGLIAKG